MKLIVLTCRTCPFFRETPGIGTLINLLSPVMKSGWCAYNREHKDVSLIEFGLPPGAHRDDVMDRFHKRLIIENRDEVPAQCPLRAEPIVVTLGS